MSSRVYIPSGVPVGVSITGGAPPGAISTPAPRPGSQSFGVFNHVNNPPRGTSPYSNVTPSISNAGSGVSNPTPVGNPNYVGKPVSKPFTANAPPTYTPSRNARTLGTRPHANPNFGTYQNTRSNPPPPSRPLSMSDRLAGRGVSAAAPPPEIQPYRPSAIPQSTAPNLSQRLAGNLPRAAASPPTPVPTVAPRINPTRLSRAVVPAAAVSALDFGLGLLAGESVGQAGAGAIGAGLGYAAGFALGNLVGGPVGGLIAGQLGSWAGSLAGDAIYNRLFPNDSQPTFTEPLARGPAPPFYGGQSVGVPYRVKVKTHTVSNAGAPNDSEATYNNVTGPILGVGTAPYSTVEGERLGVYLYYGTAGAAILVGSYLPQFFNEVSPSIGTITRMDGQPDTGGNPAPPAGSANQASLAPIVAPSAQVSPPSTAPQVDPSTSPEPFTPQNTPAENPSASPEPTTLEKLQDAVPKFNPLANPLLPLLALPLAIPSLIPSAFGSRGTSQLGSGPTTTTTTTPTGGATGNNPFCRYDSANIAGKVTVVDNKVDAATNTLNIIQTVQLANIQNKLGIIDDKLGAQIPGGGIAGQLGKMFDFAKKTWDFLQIDRVLSVLTFITVLHNGYMLSNALTQTLFSAIGNVLDVFGIEDSEGNALDVSSIVGKWTDGFFKKLFGVETVDGIKEEWKKFNRVYQAAANILYSIQSITYSMVEILETISNYVGRIGNALRKSGEVLGNAYGWMNPNANYSNNRFFNALNNTEEAVEAVDQVASEVLSIQETGAELYNQKQEFDKAKTEAEKLINDQELESKDDSTRPNVTIAPSDELKAES